MKPRLVILGAGGHALVVAETILAEGRYELAGFLDGTQEPGKPRELPGPILGDDSVLESLVDTGVEAFVVGIGGAPTFQLRKRLFESAKTLGLSAAILFHPSATVSPSASIGKGSVVLARVVVNGAARIGGNVILNTGCIVEHDCEIGDHSHLAPGAVLTGAVKVGQSCFIGANAVVLPGLEIGDGAVVGAGAVVVQDVRPETTVVGNPARILR